MLLKSGCKSTVVRIPGQSPQIGIFRTRVNHFWGVTLLRNYFPKFAVTMERIKSLFERYSRAREYSITPLPSSGGNGNPPGPVPSGRQWASLAAALLLRLGGLCVLATLLALFYSVWDFCQRLGHSVWYWLCNGLFGGWCGLLLAVGIGMMITGITIRVWLRKNGSVQPL